MCVCGISMCACVVFVHVFVHVCVGMCGISMCACVVLVHVFVHVCVGM